MDDFARGKNVTALPSNLDSFTWDTKIFELFPSGDWKLDDGWASEKVNIWDALSHLSGLPRHVCVLIAFFELTCLTIARISPTNSQTHRGMLSGECGF